MATTNIPKNVKRMAKFNFISSNYVSSVSTHANTPTPINKLMEVLHDGITSKQGTYGAVLLVGGTTAYIEFKVEEDCRFWATSGVYSDSGGASGAELNIYKYNNELQTYQLFKTVPITATEDWYVVCNLLTKGTYKIQAKGNYVQFNEFYFESIVENKTFILHDGKYKTVELIPSKVVEPEGKTPQSLVPIMTSNTAPMGVALASEEISAGDRAYRAFDGSFNTDNTGWMANSRKAWIQYQFANNKRYKVIKYRMKPVQRTPSTDPFHLNRAPKTWTFEGSNDGVNFEILDTQNMTSSWTNNFRDFEIDNDKYYNIYRVNITAPMSDSETYITIGEIQYIGKIFSEDELTVIYEKQWTTIPSTLPTHTKFNDYGMDNLSPLLDRAVTELAPLPMSDRSEILGVGEIGKVFSKTIDLKKYFDIRSIKTEVK